MREKLTLKEDIVQRYGNEKWIELQCKLHSEENPPANEDARVAFRLLEMLDFECPKYGDSHGMSEEEIKSILLNHKDEVFELHIPPPSYLGVFSGTFDFLKPELEEST